MIARFDFGVKYFGKGVKFSQQGGLTRRSSVGGGLHGGVAKSEDWCGLNVDARTCGKSQSGAFQCPWNNCPKKIFSEKRGQ